MARLWYGGTPADVVIGQGATTSILDDDGDATGDQMRYAGLPLESTTYDVYRDDLATVETDLLDVSGTPIEAVSSLTEYKQRARVPDFQGADGYEGDYYLSADDGLTFYRMPVSASTAYDRLGVVESTVAGLSTTDLDDWSDASPGHGDVATWDDAQGMWVPSTTGAVGAEQLDDLDDVETDGATEGTTLAYDSDGIYRPAALPTATTDLDDWADGDPTDGYVPVWDADTGEYVPTDLGEFTTGVQSVNGATGTVDLDADDVGAAPSSHEHSASEITSGVIGVSRLPVGVGFNQVSAGDHTHNASSITAGTLSVNRLPVGDGAGQVAAGDHEHGITSTGTLSGTMGNWGSVERTWYIQGRTVYLQLSAVRQSSGTTQTDIGWGTLPADVRPPTSWYGISVDASNGEAYSLEIESDGDVYSRNVTISTGRTLRGFLVFPLAD